MKDKKIWFMIIILAIAGYSLFVVKSVDEDSWICTDKGWIEHGKPTASKPTTLCSKIEREQAVEKYLEENISALSPQKEVLGGKFYITKTTFLRNDSGVIEYEDGHILVKATFGYKIITNSDNSYTIQIDNFKIFE